jgi:hypothetical protein
MVITCRLASKSWILNYQRLAMPMRVMVAWIFMPENRPLWLLVGVPK